MHNRQRLVLVLASTFRFYISHLIQLGKILLIVCPTWLSIYSRSYRIVARLLCLLFQITHSALTRKGYVLTFALRLCNQLYIYLTTDLGPRSNYHGFPCNGNIFSNRRADPSMALQARRLSVGHHWPRRRRLTTLSVERTWLDYNFKLWCSGFSARFRHVQDHSLSLKKWIS